MIVLEIVCSRELISLCVVVRRLNQSVERPISKAEDSTYIEEIRLKDIWKSIYNNNKEKNKLVGKKSLDSQIYTFTNPPNFYEKQPTGQFTESK